MSNLIKSTLQSKGEAKKLVPTHSFSNADRALDTYESDTETDGGIVDPDDQYEGLKLEVEALLAEKEQLRVQIQEQKQKAEEEIQQWWHDEKTKLKEHVAQVQTEAEALGYQAGYEEGYQKIQQELQQQRVDLKDSVETAYRQKEKLIEEAEHFLLQLSTHIARKIINMELERDPGVFKQYIQHTLQSYAEREEVVLEVAAERYPFILDYQEELEQCLGPDVRFKMIPSHSQSVADGCLLHTSKGTIDFTFDNQIEEIKKALLDYFEERVSQ
ncbi:FliH/SctL family protein [Caldalkalibacillus salinus]|uniref:FliH/SctL family protein n=1 Tax=Caldalkalibacillus salinus TaxID=2803787 RepID=UPI0019234BF1|nr:FliH/SctL family protein [Caldalkalibacillus salinus]